MSYQLVMVNLLNRVLKDKYNKLIFLYLAIEYVDFEYVKTSIISKHKICLFTDDLPFNNLR